MKHRFSILIILAIALTACQQFKTAIDSMPEINPTLAPENTNKTSVRIIPNGSHLKELQRLLASKGYNPGSADGFMGEKTKTAIRTYQNANNLSVDGLASYQLLDDLGGKIPTEIADSIGEGNIVERCVKSKDQDLNQLKNALFHSIVDKLQVDVSSYLNGFCVPADQTELAKLYIFLVTEGVLHSRLATTKYDELVVVFEKAGVEIAVNKDGLRRSTETLRGDVRKTAQDRVDGVSALVSHSYEVEDNEDFQQKLKAAYEQVERNSPYKEQARQLLAKVLVHSSSSTFYLVRSSYTIDKLSNYFGINVKDGLSVVEKTKIFAMQLSKNIELAYFLFSKQDDLSTMLISSTYSIRALTQDIKDIPRLDSREATQEVRNLKREEGLTLDDMEIDFDKDNMPTLPKGV